MKKSFEVNLGGRIFNIDEDAYELLNTYIESLKAGFSQSDEGDEIVADIESRLGELCETRMREGSARIIDFAMVDEYITRMGCPESMIEEYAEESVANDEPKNADARKGETREPWRDAMLLGKKLYRDMRNGLIGGVFSGLAAYTGWNVWLLRVVGIVALYFIGLLVPIVYLILWIILPCATSIVDLMRMCEVKPLPGERVEDAWRRAYERASAEMMSGIGRDNKGCLGGCLVVMLALIIAPVILFVSILNFAKPIVMHSIGASGNVVEFSGLIDALFAQQTKFINNIVFYFLLFVVVIIPVFLIFYYILHKKSGVKAIKKWVLVALLGVWSLFAVLCLYVYENKDEGLMHIDVKTNASRALKQTKVVTSRETLNAFLKGINDYSAEWEEALYGYCNMFDEGMDCKEYKYLLWYYTVSQGTDSVVPFVNECIQCDDEIVWTIMPRDEWREYIATPASLSRIKVVARCSRTAEIYCVIDTVEKRLLVDQSQCKNLTSLKIGVNSIPGWQAEVVTHGALLAAHPGSFAYTMKIYRDDTTVDGALPKLTLHEIVNGETVSKDFLQTLYLTKKSR